MVVHSVVLEDVLLRDVTVVHHFPLLVHVQQPTGPHVHILLSERILLADNVRVLSVRLSVLILKERSISEQVHMILLRYFLVEYHILIATVVNVLIKSGLPWHIPCWGVPSYLHLPQILGVKQ